MTFVALTCGGCTFTIYADKQWAKANADRKGLTCWGCGDPVILPKKEEYDK